MTNYNKIKQKGNTSHWDWTRQSSIKNRHKNQRCTGLLSLESQKKYQEDLVRPCGAGPVLAARVSVSSQGLLSWFRGPDLPVSSIPLWLILFLPPLRWGFLSSEGKYFVRDIPFRLFSWCLAVGLCICSHLLGLKTSGTLVGYSHKFCTTIRPNLSWRQDWS